MHAATFVCMQLCRIKHAARQARVPNCQSRVKRLLLSQGRDAGNVYISDAKGVRFSLSLPNNIRAGTGECEFDKVMSMEGVYIANFKDSIDTARPDPSGMQEDLQKQEDEAEGLQAEVDAKHRSVASKARREEVTRTAISFDKGGVWSYLKAPKVDSRGQKIDCPPDSCWLHLNGITKFNEFAPFYSVENAIGIIMGTGNVGSYLRAEKDEVNTYLSRDGGLTWIEAHKGAFIYEMGDHGGLLVMADDTKKTNQVPVPDTKTHAIENCMQCMHVSRIG